MTEKNKFVPLLKRGRSDKDNCMVFDVEDVLDCLKELFKRSFVDKADNVDFEERFVLWNDVVKILGEVKK